MSEVYLQLKAIQCRLAHAPIVTGAVLPTEYTFNTPCPWGKTKPDMRCKNCIYCAYVDIGHKIASDEMAEAMTQPDAKESLINQGWVL
jgi:hypothetical protein